MLPAVDTGADSTRQAERGCGPKRDYVTAARSAPSRGGPSATGTYFRAAGSRSSLVFRRSRAAFSTSGVRVCSMWNAPGSCRGSSRGRVKHNHLSAASTSRQLGSRHGQPGVLLATPWRAFHVEHRRAQGRRHAAREPPNTQIPTRRVNVEQQRSTSRVRACQVSSGCSTWNTGPIIGELLTPQARPSDLGCVGAMELSVPHETAGACEPGAGDGVCDEPRRRSRWTRRGLCSQEFRFATAAVFHVERTTHQRLVPGTVLA
jgi:hypothetical protein